MASDLQRILIADDDERPRQLLAHYLKNWGYTVVSCPNGLEAASILEGDNPPPIALIDWVMPGLEGVEICRRVRSRTGRHPYIYLILVTGNTHAAEGLEAGADDFVTKPYDVDELRARLQVGQRVVGLERHLAEHNEHLREALEQLGQLQDSGSACVCPSCKRVRNHKTAWQPVEQFLHEHTGLTTVSELCPACQEQAGGSVQAAEAATL